MSDSPAVILFDVLGHPVGVVFDGVVYRLQTQTVITDGTSIVGITDVLGEKALKVDVVRTVSSGSVGIGGTSSTFDDPFPPAGTAIGYSDGYYMRHARVYDLDQSISTEFVLGINLRTFGPSGSIETGTISNPIRVDPAGVTAQPITDNGGSITVDGNISISNFPAIQPVSGTITANQGTSPWITDVTDRAGRLLGVVYGSQGQQLKQDLDGYLLTKSVVAGVNSDGYFENVSVDLDSHLEVSSQQVVDSSNTIDITSASLFGQIPGNPFIGDPFPTRNRNIQENITTISAFNGSEPLLNLGGIFKFRYWNDVGGFPSGPVIEETLTITAFSTVRTPGWLSNAGDYYSITFEPDRPLIPGERVSIVTLHSKLTGNDFKRLPEQVLEEGSQATSIVSSFLKAYGKDGESHNIRSSFDEALRVSDDKIYTTPSGSNFVESIRDDISHKFTSVDGYEEILSLRDFSNGGTVFMDMTNGQAVFSTGDTPGNTAIFFSTKKAVYETGHGLLGEQTMVLSSYPTGDAYVELGFASDDLANGTGFGMDSVGIYTWRRKNSIYEQKTYSFSWNRDRCDGYIPSLFKFNNVPQRISAIKNNLYRIHYEWFGAAAHIYFVKPPVGGILEVHNEEYPNQYVGSSLPDPQLSLHIAVHNDTSGGGDLIAKSGSWRGGIFTSKNVQTGQNPNGDFSDIRVSGRDDNNSTDIPLVANDVFRGKWFEWQGRYSAISVNVKSDVPGTIFLDISEQTNPVNGDDSGIDFISSGTAYSPSDQLFRRISPIQSRWIRTRYINGPAAQSVFLLDVAFLTDIPTPTLQPAGVLPSTLSLVSNLNTMVLARDESATTFDHIRSTTNLAGKKGLNTNITKIEDDLLFRPFATIKTSQALIGTTAVQVASPSLPNRRSITINNDGRSDTPSRVFYGTSSAVTATPGSNAGFCIATNSSITIRASAVVDTWLICENTGGSTQTDTITGATASGTGASPDNVKISDNVYANITANAQTLILSDFSLTGTLTDISSVKIGVEANKTAGQFEQVTHQATVTGNAGNLGSVSTSSNVIAVAGQFYLAAVSREANSTVNSVTGLGLTWTQVLSTPSDDAHRRLDIWKGTGTPTGNGIVTANFSILSVNSHIAVSRYTNTDPTTPITAFNSAVANSAAPSVSVASSNAKGLAYGACAHDNTVFTQGAGFTLQSEEVTLAGANRDGLGTETLNLVSGGAQTVNGTLSGGTHWVMAGVTLNPKAAADDVVTVSYKYSGTPGATSGTQTISSSSDSTQFLDITADRGWVFTDIANVEVTVTGTTIGAAAVNVDQIFIQVVESSSNTSFVSILETAE